MQDYFFFLRNIQSVPWGTIRIWAKLQW